MKIAIAIPAFNCELQIIRVLRELDLVLDEEKSICEVLIIENNSTDGTMEATLREISTLRNKNLFEVYQNLQNIGLGGTHKIAFTLAKQKSCSHLLILHGDHQPSPFDIPVLISNLKKANGISILGSRFKDMNKLSGYSKVRIFGNLVLNLFYSIATLTKITDLGSGLNIFRLGDFEPEIYQKFDNGFTFNMDMLLYIVRSPIPFRYVPIHWSTVDQTSNARSLKVGIKTLQKLLNWLVRKMPNEQSHFISRKIDERK